MQKFDLRSLVKFSDERFQSVQVFREESQRGTLLCLKAGQAVPEHAADGAVIVHVIDGAIEFYVDTTPVDLSTGNVLRISKGRKHKLSAKADSIVFVIISNLVDL